jgi:tetratricopeptide (TPR) repeat protein
MARRRQRHVTTVSLPVIVLSIGLALLVQTTAADAQQGDYNRANELYRAGRYAEAIPYAERATEQLGRSAKNQQGYATAVNLLAVLYRRTGRYSEAERLHQSNIAIRERLYGEAVIARPSRSTNAT